MIDIQKDNSILMTPYKWSYEERRLFKIKNGRCFERTHSKWATFEIDSLDKISIVKTYDDGDYFIDLFDCQIVEAFDTYYEHWWGNKELKKEFDKGDYGYMDSFLEEKFDIDCVDISERHTAILPKEDYQQLTEIFRKDKK